jgi:hypothetical protein
MDINTKVEVLNILIETLIQTLIDNEVIDAKEFDDAASERINKLVNKDEINSKPTSIFLSNIVGEA